MYVRATRNSFQFQLVRKGNERAMFIDFLEKCKTGTPRFLCSPRVRGRVRDFRDKEGRQELFPPTQRPFFPLLAGIKAKGDAFLDEAIGTRWDKASGAISGLLTRRNDRTGLAEALMFFQTPSDAARQPVRAQKFNPTGTETRGAVLAYFT